MSVELISCGNTQPSNSEPDLQGSMEEQTINRSHDVIDDSIDIPVRGAVSVQSVPTESNSPSSWFKKTNNKCRVCSGCSGYWGIYHQNGTYEGNCRNSDGWGHTCGHGPEKHGLRRW